MMDNNFPIQYVLYTAEASELILWDDGGATVVVAKGVGDTKRFSVSSQYYILNIWGRGELFPCSDATAICLHCCQCERKTTYVDVCTKLYTFLDVSILS